MANYYIGGVGRVNAFIRKNGKLEHYFDANTLTTSGIEVSTSLEEIRGGEGAGLIAQFAHTSVFNLNMTDALFDMKYIAAQVGDIEEKEQLKAVPGFYSENLTSDASGKVTLTKKAIVLFDESQWCKQSGNIVAWATDCNNEVIKCEVDKTGKAATGLTPDTAYCVTYPYEREAAEQVIVKSMFYPAEISLILTAKLFSGDACKPSNGQPVGEIVIEIPRFQLNGTVNLSMEMSSPSTFELSGKALVSGCDCGEGGSYYARISRVEIDNGKKRFDGYTKLVALDEGEYKVGEKLYVYATGANKKPIRVYRDEYKAYVGTYSEENKYKYVNASGEMVSAGTNVIIELVSNKDIKNTITIAANA